MAGGYLGLEERFTGENEDILAGFLFLYIFRLVMIGTSLSFSVCCVSPFNS